MISTLGILLCSSALRVGLLPWQQIIMKDLASFTMYGTIYVFLFFDAYTGNIF